MTTIEVDPQDSAGDAQPSGRFVGLHQGHSYSPHLFTWDVFPIARSGAGIGTCGVSEDRKHAIGELLDALGGMPAGTHGVVKSATVDSFGDVTYNYGSLVAVAESGATTTAVVWVR